MARWRCRIPKETRNGISMQAASRRTWDGCPRRKTQKTTGTPWEMYVTDDRGEACALQQREEARRQGYCVHKGTAIPAVHLPCAWQTMQ